MTTQGQVEAALRERLYAEVQAFCPPGASREDRLAVWIQLLVREIAALQPPAQPATFLPDGSPACPHGKRAVDCGWCIGLANAPPVQIANLPEHWQSGSEWPACDHQFASPYAVGCCWKCGKVEP